MLKTFIQRRQLESRLRGVVPHCDAEPTGAQIGAGCQDPATPRQDLGPRRATCGHPMPGSPQGEITCPEVHRQRWQPVLGSEGIPQRFVGRGEVMWGDLCLGGIPGAARTQSRGCGWPASGREGTGSANSAHNTAPVPKSPEKPGMGWVLASMTHSGLVWPQGLSCTGIPHTPGPATRTQAALALPRLGERGQRGREMHFRGAAGRDWEQRGERLHASLLRPRDEHPANAVSAPRLPGESPLAFWAPRKGVQGFPNPCHVLADWGEKPTGLLAGKGCLKEEQSHHWCFQAFYLIRQSWDWKCSLAGKGGTRCVVAQLRLPAAHRTPWSWGL